MMNEQIATLCFDAEQIARNQYGVEDGGDLCFHLIESGVIPATATPDEAARIVAQHIIQA